MQFFKNIFENVFLGVKTTINIDMASILEQLNQRLSQLEQSKNNVRMVVITKIGPPLISDR